MITLDELAKMKWAGGFRCRRCTGRSAYAIYHHGRKCKTCKTVQSLTANTAFAAMKRSPILVINILMELQETYVTFLEEYDFWEDENFRNKRDIPARRTLPFLFGSHYHPKSLERLLERIALWMPKEYRKKKDRDAEFSFYSGVKKPWKYNAIFNLLFYYSNPRDEYQVAYFLLKKRWPLENWADKFLDELK